MAMVQFRNNPTGQSSGGTTSLVLSSILGGPLGFAIAKGQAHRKANWFVPVQNAFDQDVHSIIDPITAKIQAGTATLEEVQAASDAFEKLYTEFEDFATGFSQKGGDYQKVYDQAHATLDPQIKSHRQTLSDAITRLTPVDAPTPPPTLESVVPPGETPESLATKAAQQVRKRAMAGSGYKSTILGGASAPNFTLARPMLAGLSRQALRTPTILGYA